MKLEYFLTPYAKVNSKWIKDLSVKLDTIKLLEENIEHIDRIFFDINHSSNFPDSSPRVMEIKKINKWGPIKLKNFCTPKETHNERQSTEWEKIFANNVTNKGLIFKIYK